jgi:MAS20 protein import receptor
MPTTRQILTIGTAVAVLGVASYAVYFDYARRTDPQFRKKLRQSPVLAKQNFGTEITAGKEKKPLQRPLHLKNSYQLTQRWMLLCKPSGTRICP